MANEGRAFSCPDGHNQMDYEGDDFLQQFISFHWMVDAFLLAALF
jgi:hypothetical protein